MPLRVDEPRWGLTMWADDVTALGTVVSGPGRGRRWVAGDVGTLMTCEVTTGDCTTYPETTGRRVLLPVGAGDFLAVVLGGAGE